jgi:hypothetical protein
MRARTWHCLAFSRVLYPNYECQRGELDVNQSNHNPINGFHQANNLGTSKSGFGREPKAA